MESGDTIMLKTSNGRVLVGIFVTILVSALIVIQIAKSAAGDQAQINYQNQVTACEAANPVREAVVLAITTAEINASKGNALYGQAVKKITDAPYVDDKTGVRNCKAAVKQP